MKSPAKKRILKFALFALLLTVIFLPRLHLANLKAYLNPSGGGSYSIETVWGQAYSPNVGWINFYCDGAGNTRPASTTRGVATMADSCDSVAYETTYNPNTETFAGVAYSANYGWLDMSGLTMDTPIGTLGLTELTGSTNGGALSPYNFGTTYFTAGIPNAFNPGARYYNPEAYFCGFAYSNQIGYISFCDPQTKERTPKNISVPGYDWNTYAVYMGITETGDGDGDGDGGTMDPGAPTLITGPRVFAATDDHDDTLWFADDASGIASLSVSLIDANGASHTFNADYFDPTAKTARVTISNVDFHIAKNYGLTYNACDNEGNCAVDYGISNFFQVVANTPSFAAPANSFFELSTGGAIADGVESHTVRITLKDKYGNAVKSVAGIKSVDAEFIFENTTDLNQVASTGDSAIFRSSEFGLDKNPGENSTGVLTEADGGDGVFQIDISSLAPTSVGYEPISGDSIDLNFDSLSLNVTALGVYTGVGEYSATITNTDPNRIFAFQPTILATPTALVWNSATSSYEPSSFGIDNITVNAAKRFGANLVNQSSSVSITNPKIGIAIDSGASSSITWVNGRIEAANDADLTLDTDGNTNFDSPWPWANLSWISEIAKGETDSSLRFRATPQLTSSAEVSLNTTLQTYSCYTIDSKEVCHRSEKLASSGNDATLYNPGIEIVGTLRSMTGTVSKQTNNAINQSIGDFVQNEFKNSMNRSLASLRSSADANTCDSGDLTTITDSSQFESLPCIFNDGGVFYFRNTNVTLDLTSGELPNDARTLVIEGGDLYIKSNLKYPTGPTGSFGIIVLKNAANNYGNVFVYPDVTNLVGAVYAEGGVISVNSLGNYGEDSTSTCDGNAGFCDRSYELRNQLYWKGLLATANTIGGSDKAATITDPFGECPGFTCDSRATARIYDLAYLRTFHWITSDGSVVSGLKADGTTSEASLVVEYDSRIQNNPPPLFESISTGSSSEI